MPGDTTLRDRIAEALLKPIGHSVRRGESLTAIVDHAADAVLAVLGADEHTEYRVVDREGTHLQRLAADDHFPGAVSEFNGWYPDSAPHRVQSRTVLTAKTEWKDDPDRSVRSTTETQESE